MPNTNKSIKTKLPHSLFISDLHLAPTKPGITRIFLHFLQTEALKAEALYILGDFFDLWIGDDNTTEFNQLILRAFQQLINTGVPVFFMNGNRDFLIGDTFIHQTGCHFLPDPTCIRLYNTRILLTHGDALCIEDIAHQNFRKITYNPYYQRIFLAFPLTIRRLLADKIRSTSQKKHSLPAPKEIMDVTSDTVKKWMQTFQVNYLIHGHTHRPAVHSFYLDGQSAKRIVLSNWHEQQGSVLIYQSDGTFYFKKLLDNA